MQPKLAAWKQARTANKDAPNYPTLPVKPRRTGFIYMRLAVVQDARLTDEDGHDTVDIPGYVFDFRNQPTVFITDDSGWLLKTLMARFGTVGDKTFPDWQYQVSHIEKPRGRESFSSVRCGAFGFTHSGKSMNQCWDIQTMSSSPARNLIVPPFTREKLERFGYELRAWAHTHNLGLRNSLAAYGAQLLRDERFYPEPRRRVPKATNEKARPALMGNLVTLTFRPEIGTTYDVASVDQRGSHHRIVQELPLPNADSLFARGHYRTPDESTSYWARRGTTVYSRTIGQPGLICVGLHSRPTRPGEFRLHCQDFDGFQRTFLWTNTVEFIEQRDSHIDGIYAAWTASTVDTGLSLYGTWALDELAHASPSQKHWLKPLLHSTYGLLAALPRPLTVGRRTGKGKLTSFMLGRCEVPVMANQIPTWQPMTANVIQRGMIEAETTIRTLAMAEHLTARSLRVLHIHADALHVATHTGRVDLDRLRTIVPDTWRIEPHDAVHYIDDVSWISGTDAKLPGRNEYERQRQVEKYRQMFHPNFILTPAHQLHAGDSIQINERGTVRRITRISDHGTYRLIFYAGRLNGERVPLTARILAKHRNPC